MPDIKAHMHPFSKASAGAAYPIAAACQKYLDAEFSDPWQEWEALSRGVLTPVLHYMSHLLLSDLVASGEKPARLFHRIQSILSRPLGGHYVGFLRETARLYRDESLTTAVPELIDFVLRADVDCTILDSGKPLLGLLVEYRNLWAHGKFDNPEALDETVATIRGLTARLLEEIAFLERYPLKLEDGTDLMGADAAKALAKEPQPLLVVQAGDVSLRPLLLKLKGRDLVLLEDFDLSGRLVFKGTESFEKFTKKQLKKGDGAKLFEELKALLQKVRAVDAVLELPDWDTFSERSAVITDRVIALYEDMNKYVPAWYVPRPEWHGPDSIFNRFMASEQPLLALSGVQGTGKSALVSHLAHEAMDAGHAVLFINAQRFTFADVEWTGNPYPTYFAKLLHYSRPFDEDVFKRLLKNVPEGKQVVLFIDAINEVDGIEVKWNRFRAMELLLEWIAEIAQPKLKIVLSFRLDAYEEYQYLQPHEVPGRISDIAFSGTDHQNPHKSWVVDLEPFDSKQAALLYERLQQQSESGMAPAMTWQEILEGLGETIEEFTSNPLLFMIFLRAHHQENEVLSNDRDELFQRYADKLTGAAELRNWPWWRKVIGFIKDGNITPKEQLLADMVSKMAEEGSPAFLVEQINPDKGRKKDRKRNCRLMATFSGPPNRSFAELQEGGLVAIERIDSFLSNLEVLLRRVTFVSELLEAVSEGTQRRVNSAKDFRFRIISSVIWPLALAVMAATLFKIFRWKSNIYWQKDGLDPAAIATSLDYYSQLLWIPFFIIVGLLALTRLIGIPRFRKPSVTEIGLLESAVLDSETKATTERLDKALSLAVAWWAAILTLSFVVTESTDFAVVVMGALGGLMLTLLTFFGIGQLRLFLYSYLIACWNPPPIYLYRRTYRSCHEWSLRHQSWIPEKSTIGTALVGAIIFVVGAVTANFQIDAPPQVEAYSLWSLLIESYSFNRYLEFSSTFHSEMPRVCMIFGVLLLFAVFVWAPLARKGDRHEALIKSLRQGWPDTSGQLRRIILVFWVFPIVAGIVTYTIVLKVEGRKGQTGPITIGVPSGSFSLDTNGQIFSLNLEEVEPNIEFSEALNYLTNLTELRVPCGWPPIDISKIPSVVKLSACPPTIRNLGKSEVRDFVVVDSCSEFYNLYSPIVTNLTLIESCSQLGNLRDRFPNLHRLSLPETLAPGLSPSVVHGDLNFVLRISSDGPPSLSWLSPGLAENVILEFERAPTQETSNLGLVRRVSFPAAGFRPSVLKTMGALEWILIKLEFQQSPDWYREFREVLSIAVPKLQTLEFIAYDDHGALDMSSLKTAESRESALELIDDLVEYPDTLGGLAKKEHEIKGNG